MNTGVRKMSEHYRLAAYINLDAIGHNIREIRKRIEPKTQLLAIVKADAYGHGSLEVSRVCLYNGANQLGIATCDEGIALRQASITVPMLILGNTVDSQLKDVVDYRLTQAVFDFELAQKLSDTAVMYNKTALVHIKVDSGMGRIGFEPTEESLDIIDKIFALPGIQVTGVFTHFATADEKNKDFTMEQYKKFRFITDGIEARGHKGLIRHCANSGAILDCPELQLDMVRSGIITYGMFPSDEVSMDISLEPAMEWKSQVSYVKTVDEGVSIGYGRTYFTDKKTKVATIPVGYADGYSRSLSNRGRVLINGKFANVIGNICMDQMMVDVTDIEGVSAGSEVVLMGKQGENQITAEELAKTENTINYEVVCNVGKRVPRVFIRNDEIISTKAILNV